MRSRSRRSRSRSRSRRHTQTRRRITIPKVKVKIIRPKLITMGPMKKLVRKGQIKKNRIHKTS